jgi:hypothetical protein
VLHLLVRIKEAFSASGAAAQAGSHSLEASPGRRDHSARSPSGSSINGGDEHDASLPPASSTALSRLYSVLHHSRSMADTSSVHDFTVKVRRAVGKTCTSPLYIYIHCSSLLNLKTHQDFTLFLGTAYAVQDAAGRDVSLGAYKGGRSSSSTSHLNGISTLPMTCCSLYHHHLFKLFTSIKTLPS